MLINNTIINLPFNISDVKKKEIDSLPFTTPSRTDYTGRVFHHLTVLGKGPNYKSPGGHCQSQWWCICDCDEHNIILVRGANLTSNNTKSCGCQNTQARLKNIQKAQLKSRIDLQNKQFGELTAIKPTDQRKGGSVVWECRCSCGKTHYVPANELSAGRVESCGCSNLSKGIRRIKHILDNAKIPYIMEWTSSQCRLPETNACARFDFYVNNEFLLEYDGEQHFKECDLRFFHDSLKKRQEHDKYKNDWCKQNGISLKRIPYTELNNLSLELIMGDKYLIN